MARPVYPYELADPDFCWLVTNFQENCPEYVCVDNGTLPVVFIGKKEEFVGDDLYPTIGYACADENKESVEPEVE